MQRVIVNRGVPYQPTIHALHQWRKELWAGHFAGRALTYAGVLSYDLLGVIASVGPIETSAKLEQVLGESWAFFGNHGGKALLLKQKTLHMPPMVPKAAVAKKRGREDSVEEESEPKKHSREAAR